ncbi:hypothetical protein HMH39_001645 [Campylobacter jejuni]|uniref:Uncharacterized protein n=1 Tax=Campylobacter jejuni TaxID=197 RepID=A0A5T1Y727_CAMJU|nr:MULTISPECIES: hypothetical protein [Campylobacter]EAC1235636.1 hypothetical protein [Campylobacter coli]EAH4607733.1 hypothetical protein [Campylobacter jejuni]EAH5020335.1 hypothetical protein [Campylobacter jejuni]EAH5100672.1 hypothetical protein [Campylobacter jejuni]EAH5174297.1 hypothetical protein [Campylobacter jejuni]
MRKSFTNLTEQMSKKGFKLRTWAKFKKLNESDYRLLLNMSYGKTKGIRGRAKELKEMLEKDGFKVA